MGGDSSITPRPRPAQAYLERGVFHGFAHGMVALVDVHDAAGDPGREGAAQEGGGSADVGGADGLGERRVDARVLDHLLDEGYALAFALLGLGLAGADGAGGTRGERPGAQAVDAMTPLAARFPREHAGIALEGGLRARHAAAVPRDDALARQVRKAEERTAGTHQRAKALHERDHR